MKTGKIVTWFLLSIVACTTWIFWIYGIPLNWVCTYIYMLIILFAGIGHERMTKLKNIDNVVVMKILGLILNSVNLCKQHMFTAYNVRMCMSERNGSSISAKNSRNRWDGVKLGCQCLIAVNDFLKIGRQVSNMTYWLRVETE